MRQLRSSRSKMSPGFHSSRLDSNRPIRCPSVSMIMNRSTGMARHASRGLIGNRSWHNSRPPVLGRDVAHGYRVAEEVAEEAQPVIVLSALAEGADQPNVLELRDASELRLTATVRHLRLVDPEARRRSAACPARLPFLGVTIQPRGRRR